MSAVWGVGMGGDPVDFFISYNHNDSAVAQWLNDVLVEHGYTTLFQYRDCPPGTNFIGFMHDALSRSKRTLGVLSPTALASDYVRMEWENTVTSDISGKAGKLLLVRVADCVPLGIYSRIGFLDLVGVPEDARKASLIEGIHGLTQQSVPKSRPLLQASVQERLLPPLVPFLVNRRHQEEMIHAAYDRATREGIPGPLVCLIHGDEYQCHDKFIERIAETLWPKLIGRTGESARPYLLEFPHEYIQCEDIHDCLRRRLKDRLRVRPEAGDRELQLAFRTRPLLFYTNILATNWSNLRLRQLLHVLDFWEQLPYARDILRPLICICIKYISNKKWIAAWLCARKNARIRREISQVDYCRYKSIVGLTLPELLNINRGEVEDWALSDARPYCEVSRLLPAIRDLYSRNQVISMEELAFELQKF